MTEKKTSPELLMLKGVVMDLPAEKQQKIQDFKKQFEAILASSPEGEAMMAFAWIGLELQAQD